MYVHKYTVHQCLEGNIMAGISVLFAGELNESRSFHRV